MTLLPQDISLLRRVSKRSARLGVRLRFRKVLKRFQDRATGCEVLSSPLDGPVMQQHTRGLHRVVDVEPRPAVDPDRNRLAPPASIHDATSLELDAIQRGSGWRVAA